LIDGNRLGDGETDGDKSDGDGEIDKLGESSERLGDGLNDNDGEGLGDGDREGDGQQ
jgi:hypothetical protein